MCISAVANEPASIQLHVGEYGRAAEQERSRAQAIMRSRAVIQIQAERSRAISLCVSAVAKERAVIKLHEGEYSRAAEQERSRATTKRLSRAKQCDDSVRQRSCQ